MNNYFEVKVRYTKQLESGDFKRVSEPYLLAAMTFSDAESRIYGELGSLIRGEFVVQAIKRYDVHDIFHYSDSDIWYRSTISFESMGDGDEGRGKKVKQSFLVTAHSVKQATERINESLAGMMIDYVIKGTVESPIVEVFPFGDPSEEALSNLSTLAKNAGMSPVSE